MWMPIILLCSTFHAESCLVVTRNHESQMLPTKEECFKVSIEKAQIASRMTAMYHIKPMCQEIIISKGV